MNTRDWLSVVSADPVSANVTLDSQDDVPISAE